MSSAVNESRLQAWLDKAPSLAKALELRWDSMSGPIVVQRWELDELERQGATLIAEAALDHCEDLEGRARYEVVFVDASGRSLKTKAIRLDSTPANDNAEESAFIDPKETRNADGLTAMFMRHVETNQRLHNVAEANILKFYRDALTDARAELQLLREENKELRRKWKAAESKADGETDIESEAKAAAYEKLGDAVATYLIPLAAAHLGGKTH